MIAERMGRFRSTKRRGLMPKEKITDEQSNAIDRGQLENA